MAISPAPARPRQFRRFRPRPEGRKIDGSLDYVREPYLHYGLSKGWTNWLERHNRYATEEAAVRLKTPVRWKEIFARDPSVRNKALKPLVSQIPGWPLLRFIVAYVLSGGFLEGKDRVHLLRESRLLRVSDSDQAARDAPRATALTCASSSGESTTRRSLPASRRTASPCANSCRSGPRRRDADQLSLLSYLAKTQRRPWTSLSHRSR